MSGRDPSGDWRAGASLAFVGLALAALALLPIAAARYSAPLEEEIRVLAEPGRGIVTTIHVTLAQERAAYREFVQTGDLAARTRYTDAEAVEGRAYARLAALVDRLDAPIQTRFSERRWRTQSWHDAVTNLFNGQVVSRSEGIESEAERYEETILAAARLDEAIDQAVQLRRGSITHAEMLGRWLSVALGLLALAAAVVVGWLGNRLLAVGRSAELRCIELESITESRARLMRGFTHDLKNPLWVIDGYAQLFEDGILGPISPKQLEGVVRIRTGVRAMLTLVGDHMELARAENGQIAMRRERSDIGTHVSDTVDQCRAASETAGLALHVNAGDAVPECSTDADRVCQVLGNLLSNAIKYTPRDGAIDVRTELAPPPSTISGKGPGPFIAIHVTDSGPGIPVGQEEAIFGEFTRLKRETQPGVGLGLAIARRLARLLGGDITRSSAPGAGARFTLWLPVE